jgi:chemotaxis protein MotD
VSKIKLLPDETAQANLLNSAAARGAGKAAIRKIDKGKGLFNDVLGVVAKSVRTGTNTRPSSDDRTLQAPSIAFERLRRSGHEVRADAAEGDENDLAASETDSVDKETASVSDSVPDPQRMMMLAADIRHAVDVRMTAASVRQEAAPVLAPAPRLAEPDRGDPKRTAVGEGPGSARGVRGGNHTSGGPDRADRYPDATPVAATDSTAKTTESISWAEIGADRDVPTKPSLGSLAASSGKVEVIQQQTHFTPVATPSPLQQIGSAIVADLTTATADPAAVTTRSAVGGALPSADNQPLKVLTIRLDPPSLGEVTVNMRLQGDHLELHLMAAQHDTLSMLRQNRDALHDLMRDSGYVADVASVQRADAVATTSNSQQTPQGSGNGQPNAWSDRARDGSGQPSAGGEASGGDGGQDRQQFARRDPQGATGDEAAHGRRGGVYL